MKVTKKMIKSVITATALSFLFGACETPDYPSSAADANKRSFTRYASVSVSSVDATLGEDYMRGFDASMVGALEEDGIVFYNENGEQELIIRYFVEEDDGCSFNEIEDDEEFDRVVEFFENEFDDEDLDEE